MGKEFEIRREVVLPATAEQVFAAVTAGTGGWLWPMEEVEPRVGGRAAMGATVTAWEPPTHFANRADSPDGGFNALEFVIEAREGGTAVLRYVHSGIFDDDWDSQYEGVGKHTDFYLHTLGQYLAHFPGRAARYVETNAPESSAVPDGFATVVRALGLREGVAEGDTVPVDLPGVAATDAVVDYRTPHFLGLRTDDALYRFFGRNAWGAPVGFSVHLFAPDADTEKVEQAWTGWLSGVFA